MNEIGKRIEDLRKEKGWSQESIAMELGISQPSYARLIKQSESITIERLIRISKSLGVSIFDIIGEKTKCSNCKKSDDKTNTLFYQDKNHILTLKEEIAFLRELLRKST
jgi:transcriptional regulator with XRE-family HTH domain